MWLADSGVAFALGVWLGVRGQALLAVAVAAAVVLPAALPGLPPLPAIADAWGRATVTLPAAMLAGTLARARLEPDPRAWTAAGWAWATAFLAAAAAAAALLRHAAGLPPLGLGLPAAAAFLAEAAATTPWRLIPAEIAGTASVAPAALGLPYALARRDWRTGALCAAGLAAALALSGAGAGAGGDAAVAATGLAGAVLAGRAARAARTPRAAAGGRPAPVRASGPPAPPAAAETEDLRGMLAIRERELRAVREGRAGYLANMSHEIRTPLNAIAGNLDILRRELRRRGVSDPEVLGPLDDAATAAAGLAAVVSDVLDLSRAETGRIDVVREPFRPADLAADVEAVFRGAAAKAGVSFACVVDPGMPGRVVHDRRKLGQTIVNLAGNGLKFTPRGGIVAVTLSWEGPAEGRGALAVRVVDSGRGFAQSEADRLMEPFEQSEADDARARGGTGLGLSIVRHVLHAMDARLRCDARPGVGVGWSFSVAAEGRDAPADPPRPRPDALLLLVGGTDLRDAAARLAPEAARRQVPSAADARRRADDGHAACVVLDHVPDAGEAEELRGLAGVVPVVALLRGPLAPARVDDAIRGGAVHVADAGDPDRAGRLLRGLLAPAAHDRASAAGEGNAAARSPAATTLAADRPILVVDDVAGNRALLVRQLRELGLSAETAVDGVEALERLDASGDGHAPFAAMLVDWQMPRLDGVATTRRIREDEARAGRRRLPIVGCTARATEEDRAQGLAAGMDGFLVKPVAIEELRAALAAVLPPLAEPPRFAEPPAPPPPSAAPGTAPGPVPRAVAAPPPAATTRAVAAPPPAATTRAVAAPPPAATTRAVAAAIDVATLEAVAGPLSDAATRDYLTGFLEEMEPILGALAAAVAAGDAEDAAMRAHAARGAAANVGASVLVAACAAVEDEIRRRGSAAGVARVHGDVAPAWRAVRARLGELLAAQREDAR